MILNMHFNFRYETQVGLVRNSWSDLFVLGLAQISSQVSIPTLLSIIVSHQQNRLARDNTPINVKEVTASICKIHDYVQTLSKLNLTQTEFAYLRTIALFGAGELIFISSVCAIYIFSPGPTYGITRPTASQELLFVSYLQS